MKEDGIRYGPDGSPRYFSPAPDMRPDPDAESMRFLERLEAERVSRLAAQEQERAEQTFRAEKAAALSLMDTARAVEGYQRFVAAVCDRFKIRMEIGVNPNYLGAAWSRARKIHVRPIVDAETFAVALHEIGHILAGECSRREPHRPVIEDGCYLCIACETSA